MYNKNREKIVKFFKEMLDVYDFQIVIDINDEQEKIFRLNDIQKGNLGNIEQEHFVTLADIVERLEIYHQDYIYNSLENRQENNEIIEKNDWDLVAKRYLENDNIAKVLNDIDANEYAELITRKRKFRIEDIIEILDEDEKFYKTICEKYVLTMSKEMLLEKDNKILHIFVEDEYIELKEAGKININNYEQYLDGNFEVYEYDYYQDLFNSVIKDEIAYDLNDLELFDSKGNWDFYITFEELKKVGYGFMVKDQYPLIQKYILEPEEVFEFFDYFSLEELNDFEQTLNLYFETNDIEYDEKNAELYSKSNSEFNSNIIYLAEGLLSYEDFLEDYKEQIVSYSDLSISKVIAYFNENKIEDLMGHGADTDEGLYKLSSMYQEILDKLDIKYKNISTIDGISPGKFVTKVIMENESEIILDTSGWNGIDVVTNNIASVYEFYDEIKENLEKNNDKKSEEISYEYE